MTKRVTMTDVAAAAQVSPTTVSFVLNGNDRIHISDATKDRVIKAAADLGYRQNFAAQALASRRTHLIGLVTDTVTTPFAGSSILGAQSAALASDYQVLIASIEPSRTPSRSAFELLLQRQVEGIALISATHRILELTNEAYEIPTVLINSVDESGRLASILPNEVSGGYKATKTLLDAGHRRVGFLNLEAGTPAAVGRYHGYSQALNEAGIRLESSLVLHRDATATGGYTGANELFDSPLPPTAVFCATDRMAMGAYDAIKERGMRIPQDVSIVGFDDMELITEYLHPRLTTVALPFREMAELAIATLIDCQNGTVPAPVGRLVEGQLILRDSVAPPPS